jgi:hypothetical protein
VSPINEQDLDRLADYAADLLDPAEAAEVDRLIDEDPAWARAYADLTAAGPRLDDALCGLSDAPMPEDVAERLEAVLALQSPPAGTRTAEIIDLSARRRWMRRTAWVATAAAVVAAIFGGITVLGNTARQTAGNSAGSQFNSAPRPAGAPPPTIQHSGTNYTAQTLPRVGREMMSGGKSASGGPADTAGVAPQVPHPAAGIDRLENQPALDACLAAITAAHGGYPVLVDYAYYLGAPALIVVLDAGGTRVIVVAGPRCGQPGAGPDERASRTG